MHSLVQPVQIEDADLAKKIACLHGGEDLARLAEDLQDAIGDDEHLAGHLALPADGVARREDVGLHLEHEIVKELGLALLENGHLLQHAEVDM